MSAGVKIRVVTYSNDMACDCGAGMMRPTGHVLLTHPPKYPHKCESCGASETFDRQYPYVTYEAE